MGGKQLGSGNPGLSIWYSTNNGILDVPWFGRHGQELQHVIRNCITCCTLVQVAHLDDKWLYNYIHTYTGHAVLSVDDCPILVSITPVYAF